MERKYKLSGVENVQVIDMLKEKISAGARKIRQYKEKELHYHQDILFATNQKQSYEEADGRSNILYKASDGQKVLNIRSKERNIKDRTIRDIQTLLEQKKKTKNRIREIIEKILRI